MAAPAPTKQKNERKAPICKILVLFTDRMGYELSYLIEGILPQKSEKVKDFPGNICRKPVGAAVAFCSENWDLAK